MGIWIWIAANVLELRFRRLRSTIDGGDEFSMLVTITRSSQLYWDQSYMDMRVRDWSLKTFHVGIFVGKPSAYLRPHMAVCVLNEMHSRIVYRWALSEIYLAIVTSSWSIRMTWFESRMNTSIEKDSNRSVISRFARFFLNATIRMTLSRFNAEF